MWDKAKKAFEENIDYKFSGFIMMLLINVVLLLFIIFQMMYFSGMVSVYESLLQR